MKNCDYTAPDFLGIGMERAGTSWVFTQLAAHPDIWVPPLKELHYFDVIDPQAKFLDHRYSYHLKSRIKQKAAPFLDMSHRPEFAKTPYGLGFLWDYYYFTDAFDDHWYRRLFHPRFTKGRICGEITPAYSNLSPQTIEKILAINPQMKFILMVRNPYERLWSGIIHYFTHVQKTSIEHVSDSEILAYLEQSRASERSDLGQILTTWQTHVPPENLLIQRFEDIAEAPKALIRVLYAFLGLRDDYLPEPKLYQRKINQYSKQEHRPSQTVDDRLKAACAPVIERLSTTHPAITQTWKRD